MVFSNSLALSLTRRTLLYRFINKRLICNGVCEPTGFCFEVCLSLLKRIGEFRVSNHGKSVHCLCIKAGFSSDVFVQNNLLMSYVNYGDLRNARLLFDEIPEPNLVSWTSLVSSHIRDGQYELGLLMFHRMIRSGISPNEFGFSVALKACRIMHRLNLGLVIHGRVLKSGFELDRFCCSSILGMYLECGNVDDALKFFDGIPLQMRSEASWNTLIDSYVLISSTNEAVKLFNLMMKSGLSPNCFTYSILLKLCAKVLIPELGRAVHGQTVKVGFEDNVIIGGSLVDFYAKSGLTDDALRLFWDLEKKDNMVWCALLSGFHQIGDSNRGLTLYSLFLKEGNKPDPFNFSIAFGLCSNLECQTIGTQIHCSLIKDGFAIDSVLGSSLINMYGNIGMVSDAHKCFHEVTHKDEICFGAIINNLVLNSNDEAAIELFSEMIKLGLQTNQSTISYVLRALGDLDMLKQGMNLHSHVLKKFSDCDLKLSTENALVEMYAKCKEIGKAKSVFKAMREQNEYSWTVMMTGISQFGKFEEVLGLFRDMLLLRSQSEKPSEFTIVVVIQACTDLEALGSGTQIHGYIVKSGFSSHPFVQSSLIGMYSKFKTEIQNAFSVFSSTNENDLISRSAMFSAWIQNGYYEEALKNFIKFHNNFNFLVDESILSSCFSACAGFAAMEIGKCLHVSAIKLGLNSHIHVASSVIDMYSKCGYINEARRFFDETEERNLITWTAMISGYAYNGLGKISVHLFNKMKETGLKPDGITFIGALTACSHAGLVSEGWDFFKSMSIDYDLDVTVNHYACMVDLLGRNEQVEEAESLVEDSPFESRSKYLLWKTLLGACNTHGNIEIGNRIAKKMLEFKPEEPSTYVLMSNIYASASMWDDSIELRSKMRGVNVVKTPGSSWIHLPLERFVT